MKLRELFQAHRSPGSAQSAALQSVGVLSVLVFLVAHTHEVLAFKGLQGTQVLLLGLLQSLLAAWALGEVLLLESGTSTVPLRGLKFALLAQLLIGLLRYTLGQFHLVRPSLLSDPDGSLGFGLATALGSLYLLTLLLVGKLLVEAFAFTERQRADMLRAEVAERERAEAGLREAREAAEAASRAKSVFLANMSHEIRTPLTGVLGLAQVGLGEAREEDQRGYFQKIDASARLLLAILEDILDLSKVEAGKLRLEPAPFELDQLLTELRVLVEPTAREKGLGLHMDPLPEGPRVWVADRLRLSQVLLNLLSNAVKFTPAGEVRLVCSLPAPGRLRFEVHDTGIGMDPAQQARVFEPFVQAEDGTTRRFGGTGLGLTISRQLAQLMGGSLELRSEPGRGSVFAFELPAEPCPQTQARQSQAQPQPAEAPAPAASTASSSTMQPRASSAPAATAPLPSRSETGSADAPAPRSPPRWPGRRLLLAEDSDLVREVVLRMLRDTGLTLEVAHDGLEAVERCEQQPPDLVLMDIQMPLMDGNEAARRILARHPDLPIVALTAYAQAEAHEKSRAAGMRGHLVKPFTIEALQAVLLDHLGPGDGAPGQAPPADSAQTAPGSFPALAGIDQRRAERLLDGDRGLFLRMLAVFREAFGDTVARTREDLAAGALRSAARRLHTLRGSARHLGAMDVALLAEALEDALDQGESDLEDGLEALEQALNTLLGASVAVHG